MKRLIIICLYLLVTNSVFAYERISAESVFVTNAGATSILQAVILDIQAAESSLNGNFTSVSNSVDSLIEAVNTNAFMDDFNSGVGNINFDLTEEIFKSLGVTTNIDYQLFTTNAYSVVTNITGGISNIYETIDLGDADTLSTANAYALSVASGTINSNFSTVSQIVEIVGNILVTNASLDDFNSEVGNDNFEILADALTNFWGGIVDFRLFSTNSLNVTTGLLAGVSNVYQTIDLGDDDTYTAAVGYVDGVAAGLVINENFNQISNFVYELQGTVNTNARLSTTNALIANQNERVISNRVNTLAYSIYQSFASIPDAPSGGSTNFGWNYDWDEEDSAFVTNDSSFDPQPVDFGSAITAYVTNTAQDVINTNNFAINAAITNLQHTVNTNAYFSRTNALAANHNFGEIGNSVNIMAYSIYKSFTNMPGFVATTGVTNFGFDYEWVPLTGEFEDSTNELVLAPVDFGSGLATYINSEAQSVAVAVVSSNVINTAVEIPITAPFVSSNITAQIEAFYTYKAAIINGAVSLMFTNTYPAVTNTAALELSTALQLVSFGGNTVTFDFSTVDLYFEGDEADFSSGCIYVDGQSFNPSKCVIENLTAYGSVTNTALSLLSVKNLSDVTIDNLTLSGATATFVEIPWRGLYAENVERLELQGGFSSDVGTRALVTKNCTVILNGVISAAAYLGATGQDSDTSIVDFYSSRVFGMDGSSLSLVNNTTTPTNSSYGVSFSFFSEVWIPLIYGENFTKIVYLWGSSKGYSAVFNTTNCSEGVYVGLGSYFRFPDNNSDLVGITAATVATNVTSGGAAIVENVPGEANWYDNISTNWHTLSVSTYNNEGEYVIGTAPPIAATVTNSLFFSLPYGASEYAICEYRLKAENFGLSGTIQGGYSSGAGGTAMLRHDYGTSATNMRQSVWTAWGAIVSEFGWNDYDLGYITPTLNGSGIEYAFAVDWGDVDPVITLPVSTISPVYSYDINVQRRRVSTP